MKKEYMNWDNNHKGKNSIGKKYQEIRMACILVSILIGLQCEALFYYVFGINPVFVPVLAIIVLWVVNSIVVGCVIDEWIRRKYQIRIYTA